MVYYYASVGGAMGHTVVVLCISLCICRSMAVAGDLEFAVDNTIHS